MTTWKNLASSVQWRLLRPRSILVVVAQVVSASVFGGEFPPICETDPCTSGCPLECHDVCLGDINPWCLEKCGGGPQHPCCCSGVCCAGACCHGSCCNGTCCTGLCCNDQCFPGLSPLEYMCCYNQPCAPSQCCAFDGCCPDGAPCCDGSCCQVGQSCCDGTCVDVPPACCGEPDCNGNHIKDECDISSQSSTDQNADGVPDECQFPNVFIGTGGGGAPGTSTGGGRVYRYLGGTEWEDMTPGGLGGASVVLDLAVYRDHLYAATQTLHGYAPGPDSQGQVWRHEGGTTWTLIDNLGDAGFHVDSVTDIEVFNGQLHAIARGGAVYRCTDCDGADWERVPQAPSPTTGFRTAFVSTLCGSEELFIGESDADDFWRLTTASGAVLENVDPQSGSCIWDIVRYDGPVPYENALYAGAFGGLVYRMDVAACGSPDFYPFADTGGLLNWALAEYKGKLYVGAASDVLGGGPSGARLLSYDQLSGEWNSSVRTWPTTFAGEGVSCLGSLFDSGLFVGLGTHEAYDYWGDGNATVWRYDGTTLLRISPDDAFGGGVQCILVTYLAGSECGDGMAEGSEACDGNDLRGASCASLGYAFGSLRCSQSCQYDATECATPPSGCGDGIANNAECCDGADMGATPTCESLGFQAGSLTCSPLCTYDAPGCTPPLGTGRNPVAVVNGDRALVSFNPGGDCPAAAYMLEYDPSRVTVWNATTEGAQILPYTRYSGFTCGDPFYAQAESPSVALNDVPITLRVDPWTGVLELIDEVAVTCVAIDISPSAGPVGTPLTISLTPAIAPLAFDCATHAEWRGHFQPLVGSPGDEIAIVYGADRLFESSPGTATIFIGDGRLATGMSALSLLVGSDGALVGTATVSIHGLQLRRPLTLVPDPPNIRARELISDPNDLTLPRQYGDVLTQVEIVPILEPMLPDALTGNLGDHFALELCVSGTGQPPTPWPSTLTVTLATVDAAGIVIDSVPGVTLHEAPSADWPGCHVYRTAVDAPIIAVDSTVDKQIFPSLTILVAGHESDIAILPGGPP